MRSDAADSTAPVLDAQVSVGVLRAADCVSQGKASVLAHVVGSKIVSCEGKSNTTLSTTGHRAPSRWAHLLIPSHSSIVGCLLAKYIVSMLWSMER